MSGDHAHDCIQVAELATIKATVKNTEEDFKEHRKGAWMRVGVAGVIGGFIGTGAGEFMIRIVTMAFGMK